MELTLSTKEEKLYKQMERGMLLPTAEGDVLAINAASASTQISGLPFSGPVGATRVALIDNQWVAFTELFNAYRDAMLAAIDEEIAKVVAEGVDDATLARIKTRMLADWYNGLESFLSRADTLAKLQLMWDDAGVVNRIPGWIDAVTSADVQRAARTYLTRDNRTVIDRKPDAMLQAARDGGPDQD